MNNLYRDQDFFALKMVKIPVREHGVLTETQQLEKCRQNTVTERTSGNQSSSASDEVRMGGKGTYYCSGDEEKAGEGSFFSLPSLDAQGYCGFMFTVHKQLPKLAKVKSHDNNVRDITIALMISGDAQTNRPTNRHRKSRKSWDQLAMCFVCGQLVKHAY